MDILFSGREVEELRPIFCEDLHFKGPFYESHSAEEYINSLKADSPEGFAYEIMRSYEDESSACLVYQFSKPGVTTFMAQVFEIERDKISKILLVFDTGAFK